MDVRSVQYGITSAANPTVQYGITPAANPTTVPNTNAVKNGGPLTNAIITGAKDTSNFVNEHAGLINDGIKAGYKIYKYIEEGNLADLGEGIEASADLLFGIL